MDRTLMRMYHMTRIALNVEVAIQIDILFYAF